MRTKNMLVLATVLVGLFCQEVRAFYNSSTGRWLSRDPLGTEGGLNALAIVANNLVNESDYLGLVELKHIGPGFQYVKGPPEFFWLGLQARLTQDEASKVGQRVF